MHSDRPLLTSFTGKLFLALLAVLPLACASASSYYEKGEKAYLEGDFEAASRHYRSVKRMVPAFEGIDEKIRITEIRLFMRRGDAAVARLDWVAAQEAYEEVRYRDPHNPELPGRLRDMTLARAEHHFLKGSRLFEGGDPFTAIPELERALAFRPDHPQAQVILDQARVARREREAHAERLYQEGRTALTLGLREQALALFAEAVELNPRHAPARQELSDVNVQIARELMAQGDVHMENEKWQEAIRLFREALEYDPNHLGLDARILSAENEAYAEILLVEAHRSFEEGDWPTAFAAFEEAWHLTEKRESFRTRYDTARREYAEDLYSESRSLEIEGRIDGALACLDTIENLYVEYRNTRQFRARLLQRKQDAARFFASGKRAQSVGDLVAARDFFTACKNAIVNYKDVYARLDTIRVSLDQAERLYVRALAAERVEDHARARILFEECLSLAKPYRDALERLAELPSSATGGGDAGGGGGPL